MTRPSPSTPPPVRVALRVVGQPPLTRGECEGGARPCVYTICQYHLLVESDLDATRATRKVTAAKWNPSLRVHPATRSARTIAEALRLMPESCSLDVADRGGSTQEEVAEVLGVTRQRVEQIEWAALRKLAADERLREMAK